MVSVTIRSSSMSQLIIRFAPIFSLTVHDSRSHDRRHAHAAADAEGGQPVAQLAPFQLVHQRAEDHRPGRAQRVAECDRAAVDVDLLGRYPQVAQELQHHRGERLVDLEQVDVLDAEAGPVERLTGGRRRPGEHDGGLLGDHAGSDHPGSRPQPGGLPGPLAADQHQRRPVHDSGGVAGGVHVPDPLHPVVLLQRDRIEAALAAQIGEGRLEPGQRFQCGAGPGELVALEHGQSVAVPDRHQRAVEGAVGLCLGRLGLRVDGEGVDILAVEALESGDQIRADALRYEAGGVGGLRVHRPGAAVGSHRHPRHRLHATGQQQVLPARAHLLRRDVHRLQAGGAEPVDLHAGSAALQAGGQRGGPGDHRALVADRSDHAQHHVLDQGWIQARIAPSDLLDQPDHQRDRLGLVQRAGLLAATARGADRVEDEGFGRHGGVLRLDGRADAGADDTVTVTVVW